MDAQLASRRRSASRRSRASAARRSSRATTASSGSRACRRTTTGWSRSGAADSGGALIPLCIIPLWDVELAAAEVRAQRRPRRARRLLQRDPAAPRPAERSTPAYWDPFFAACDETDDTSSACTSARRRRCRPRRPTRRRRVGVTLTFNNAMASLADCLFSGVLVRFPKLKLAYSEGQIGWIPYVLERADNVWEHHRRWSDVEGARSPSRRRPTTTAASSAASPTTAHGLRVARRGRRRQHLLRDRLPAHRLDVAVHARSTSRR